MAVDPQILLRAATGLLPVLAFLLGLMFIDSYKLVRLSAVARTLAVGVVVAAACYVVNVSFTRLVDLDFQTFSRYVAPLIEESLKSAYVVFLIRRLRVGFVVDAAIHGFAIGAGFAFAENLYYLAALVESDIWTWMVRGFGTAIMHGGTMAVMGMVTKSLFDQSDAPGPFFWIPGLAMAYALHALFNHFILPPLQSTVVLLFVFPLLLVIIFQQSEKTTHRWLGEGFDLDQELLQLLESHALSESRVGMYLHALRARFPGQVVGDMLCLLRLHVELSIRAKGVLMMQEAGFQPVRDPEVGAKLAEIDYLKQSIGTTGMLALAPFLNTGNRELWQQQMLSEV